jgi:hypothetical protein
MDHTKHEFEEQKEHDEKHEELVDDKLQPTTKKTKASLAHTQRKTRNGNQGTLITMKKGIRKLNQLQKR